MLIVSMIREERPAFVSEKIVACRGNLELRRRNRFAEKECRASAFGEIIELGRVLWPVAIHAFQVQPWRMTIFYFLGIRRYLFQRCFVASKIVSEKLSKINQSRWSEIATTQPATPVLRNILHSRGEHAKLRFIVSWKRPAE